MTNALARASRRTLDWTFSAAAPVWVKHGFDSSMGRFFEKLHADSGVATEEPTRTIVQARQIYSFCVLGRFGWPGAWQNRIKSGFAYLKRNCALPDGAYAYSTNADGSVCDARVDLCTQAFVIFALGNMARAFPECIAEYEAAAVSALGYLRENLSASGGGFHEIAQDAPLTITPHMHLLEAGLAWMDASDWAGWRKLCQEIVDLALEKFIRPDGSLQGIFQSRWAPIEAHPESIATPGLQFEWAWLLARWAGASAQPQAFKAARALAECAERRGVDRRRRVVTLALGKEAADANSDARLWPQAERLKAQLMLAKRSIGIERIKNEAAALEAVNVMFEFFAGVKPGLWRDRMFADGGFKDEAAPASSFYHVACAFEELQLAVKRDPVALAS